MVGVEFVLKPVEAVEIVEAAGVGARPSEENVDERVGVDRRTRGEGDHSHCQKGRSFVGNVLGGGVHKEFDGSVWGVGEPGELFGEPAVSEGDRAEIEKRDGTSVLEGDEGFSVLEEIEGLGFNQKVERGEAACI